MQTPRRYATIERVRPASFSPPCVDEQHCDRVVSCPCIDSALMDEWRCAGRVVLSYLTTGEANYSVRSVFGFLKNEVV